MKYLVCLLEEPSAKELLEELLQHIVPENVICKFMVFDGKSDLEKNIVPKIRGWLMPDTAFLVMRDQDSSDCKELKKHLLELCNKSGKRNILVRIACHELESFYFGDLEAVEKGLGIENISKNKNNAKYRVPDEIKKPCDEFEKLTKGKYQHIMGSRAHALLRRSCRWKETPRTVLMF